MERRKLVVVGGGPGGYVAAIRAAQLGADVTLVEKDALGGTCLNRGCIPTKALLQSAGLLSQIRRAEVFGISVQAPSLDYAKVLRRKEAIVDRLVDGVAHLMRKDGIAVIQGVGTLVDRGKVRVVEGDDERILEADGIIIATGSEPAMPPIEGIDSEGVLNSDQVLNLEELPRSLIVIGGGVVGIEFAQIFHRISIGVTVIEMMPRILPTEDAEIGEMLEKLLREEGIDIVTGATVRAIQTGTDGQQAVSFTTPNGDDKRLTDRVLVAVGRRPCTRDLGLEGVGIAPDGGHIAVNGRMETGVEGIYAVGDVVGGSMLAHTAMAEGRCAAANAARTPAEMDYRAVPRCVYTSPEVAAVGLREDEARREFGEIRIGKFPLKANGKALICDETEGMVKFIADAHYGQVLGVSILGPHATELIAEAALGIRLEATVDDIASTIYAHPTLSEAVMEAALDVTGETPCL